LRREIPNINKSFSAKRGQAREVLRNLLDEQHREAIIELFEKVISRNEELERLLAMARAKKSRKEGVPREQLDLFVDKLKNINEGELNKSNQDLQEVTKKNIPEIHAKIKPPKQPAARRPAPDSLRRVDNPIPVPEQERPCPVCGQMRHCVSHETCEVIELIPAEVIVRRDIREVLSCKKCDGEMVRAPSADKVVPGGYYGPNLVSKLIVGKYDDSLPLERQRQELDRLGISIPSSSLSDQIRWGTDLLRPIWRHLLAATLESTVMHLDGTGLPTRDKDSPNGIISGALWGYVGDEKHAVYLYTSTGKKNGQKPGELGPEDVLAMRHGFAVADASNLFDNSFKNPNLIEIGCNMHARRYFVKALDSGDVRASVVIDAFKALYDVEELMREASCEERFAARTTKSRPIYEQIKKWCDDRRFVEPPSSLLAKAISYLENHYVALTRFLDDGRIPIDNGIVERLHRRPAVGRRNFLFAGSYEGGLRAAIAYSILGSCRLNGVNPIHYLADILPRMARGVSNSEIPSLLPAAWKATNQNT
jgi:transposase